MDQPTTQATCTVSVIVPCRNEEASIADCLASILQQELVPEDFEVIVADGASTDRTRDVVQHFAERDPRIKLIENPRRIVPTGLNAAIGIARGSIIMRMDAHTVYARDYIHQCIAVLQQTGADNVGGPALTVAHGLLPQVISAAYHSPFAVGGAKFHNPRYDGYVDTVPYGCWPKSVFSRIGLFDEELVRNQDDEFNLRLTRAGGTIWQSPRIKSWYQTRGNLADLFRQYRQYGYWKVRVIQKHKLPASFRHLVPAGFLMSLMTLSVLSFLWAPAFWGLFGLIALYLACNLGASLVTASKNGWKLLPLLPVVFATYHFSYGLGFLRGLLDFVVFRQRPHPSLMSLSRGPAADS